MLEIEKALKHSKISGREYLKTIVQLPIYLTDYDPEAMTRYRKLKKHHNELGNFTELLKKWSENENTQTLVSSYIDQNSVIDEENETETLDLYRHSRLISSNSASRSVNSLNFATGGPNNFDFNSLLGQSPWYKSMSPQQMKRQLNIISLTSRLLRASYKERIEWDRLAAWTHLIETWPYRASWIILWVEENMTDSAVFNSSRLTSHSLNIGNITSNTTLSRILGTLLPFMPSSTEHGEALLAIDEQDAKSLEIFLECRQPVLTAADVKKFLPMTINIDHQLKQYVADVQDAMASSPVFIEGMNTGIHPYLLFTQMTQGQNEFFKEALQQKKENDRNETRTGSRHPENGRNSAASTSGSFHRNNEPKRKHGLASAHPSNTDLATDLPLSPRNTIRENIKMLSNRQLLDWFKDESNLENMTSEGRVLVTNFLVDNDIDGEILLMLKVSEIKNQLSELCFKDWLKIRKFLKNVDIAE